MTHGEPMRVERSGNLGQSLNLTRETELHQKKSDDDAMSGNYDVIVIFVIYSLFGAIRKPDSGCKVSKLIFSSIVTFYLAKPKNRTKISLT